MLESFFNTIFVPFQKTFTSFGKVIIDRWTDFREFGSLRKENRKLHMENLALRQELAGLREKASENRSLRKLLKLARSGLSGGIPAEIIARDAFDWFSNVTVDKGSSNGVTCEMVAVSPEGLVGKVFKVYRYSARVRLIMAQKSAIPAIVSETRSLGIVQGSGDGMCIMKYVSSDSKVKPGDRVFTSGLGYIFPRGIMIGEVVGVQDASGALFKSVRIKPSVDFGSLEHILLVKKQ